MSMETNSLSQEEAMLSPDRAVDLSALSTAATDYDIVRRVSVESVTFFGTLAFFVGVAFNIGLFARFGFIYISLIALEDKSADEKPVVNVFRWATPEELEK